MLRSMLLAPGALALALPALAGSTLDVPGSYPTIADALAAATSGDTVLVQPGTYTEYDLSFGGKDLHLLSVGGAEVTTIRAATLGRVLIFDGGETLAATVEGFTLKGGRAPKGLNATGPYSGGPGEDGGCVLLLSDPLGNPSSATFRNCVFLNNRAGTGGKGGVGLDGYDGTSSYGGGDGHPGHWGGTGGLGGAIASLQGGSLVIEGCHFEDNHAGAGGEGGQGGRGGDGVSGPFGTGTPDGNGGPGGQGGYGGYGGAIAQYGGLDLTVLGCVFYANASGLGGLGGPGGQGGSGGTGGGYTGAPGASGIAGDGGAVYSQGQSLVVTASTFAANTIDDGFGGGAIYSFDLTATLRNCLIWGNDLPSVMAPGGLVTTYCDIEGELPSGIGDIDADPLFADLAAGDLHLTKGSPCLHAGDPDTTGLLPFDMDGEPRVIGIGVDIGADEAFWDLMGTGEDFLLETEVNHGGDVYATPKTALAGDSLTVYFHSPNGTFVGSIPWLVLQGFNTGSALGPDPFNPGLWVDTTAGSLTIIRFGIGPLGPTLLPASGIELLYQVGPGLVGLSVRFQAIAISPAAHNGIYATTDALDVVLQ